MRKMIIWATASLMAMTLTDCERHPQTQDLMDPDPRIADRTELACLGDPESQYLMGICCDHEQDYCRAAGWYLEAAKHGHAYAQYQLADCYYYGIGVRQSYDEAARWYQEAAEHGIACAQDNLANCYFDGLGRDQSYAEALRWYRKAARQGNTHAMNALGICHYQGIGVPQSQDSAVYWFQQSAKRGDKIAEEALAQIE